MAAFRKKLMLT